LIPRELVKGGRLNLLVASPECTHHSNARGGRPMNDQSRASAWHVLRWAEALYIENILIENVKEFRSWGPLGAEGRPIKRLKGELFLQFLESLRALGYRVEEKILNAADYGDPTTRERLFVIARRGGRKIIWPKQTHAAPEKLRKQKGGMFAGQELIPWVPAREVIDWSLQGQSIFNRKKPLARKTLERIYAGLRKFGGPNAEPFLIVLRRHMDAQSIDGPLPTLTAGGNHVGLVEPFLSAYRGDHAGRDDGKNRNHPVDAPLPTQDCSNRYAVVQPEAFLIGRGGPEGAGRPQSIDEPLNTVLTENHRAVCEPVLVNMKGKSTARSVNSPLPTQTTKNHVYVAEPEAFILPHRMFDQGAPDSIERPLRTLVGKNARQVRLCEPVMVNIDHRGGNGDQTRSVDASLSTVTTKARTALIEPFLVDVNHGAKAQECPQREGARRCQSVDQPLNTVTTKRGKGIVEPCLVKYNGTAKAQSIQDPLDTVTTKDRFALVTTEHGTFALDIRLRMLRPHELAAAMSLRDYKFTGKMEEQVKQIGNAVPGKLAEALTGSLIQEYAQ
jgi:DNA (cytosine-5)-methyltransferase 1